MNYSEVKVLIDAGFTAQEIREMFTDNTQFSQVYPQFDNTNDNETHDENSSENPANHQTDRPVSDLAEAETFTENPNNEHIDRLNENITRLIKTIQSSNRLNTSFNNETDIDTQVDTIMAGLIRPEHNAKGDINT